MSINPSLVNFINDPSNYSLKFNKNNINQPIEVYRKNTIKSTITAIKKRFSPSFSKIVRYLNNKENIPGLQLSDQQLVELYNILNKKIDEYRHRNPGFSLVKLGIGIRGVNLLSLPLILPQELIKEVLIEVADPAISRTCKLFNTLISKNLFKKVYEQIKKENNSPLARCYNSLISPLQTLNEEELAELTVKTIYERLKKKVKHFNQHSENKDKHILQDIIKLGKISIFSLRKLAEWVETNENLKMEAIK